MIHFDKPNEVAGVIDQTLLQPTASLNEVQRFCEESAALGFAAVCIAPSWVRLAVKVMEGSQVRVCTVAGFPLGFETVEIKARAVQAALDDGAAEIDYVVNLGAVKGGDYGLIEAEMQTLRRRTEYATVKAILETAYLAQQEKKQLCKMAVNTGLDFVKTSTGFGPAGATEADVALLLACVQGKVKVKAAGGIRTLHDLQKMLGAGAHRIGTSAGKEILEQIAANEQV